MLQSEGIYLYLNSNFILAKMDNVTLIIIYITWIILILNKIFSWNSFVKLTQNLMYNSNLFKFTIYNVSLIIAYFAIGFKYLDTKFFILHIVIFLITNFKIKTNNNAK
jgi:hypothetical protein